ncbi:MAG: hypothetical protein KDK33_17230 [Leptospiraceae bacterium]|nr:hypothetical protein [Leptospiraceae bacterium]
MRPIYLLLMLSAITTRCASSDDADRAFRKFISDPNESTANAYLLPRNATNTDILEELKLGTHSAGRSFLVNRNDAILSNSRTVFAQANQHRLFAQDELNGIHRSTEELLASISCDREIVSFRGQIAFLIMDCLDETFGPFRNSPFFDEAQWTKTRGRIQYEFTDRAVVQLAQEELYQNLGALTADQRSPQRSASFRTLMNPGPNGVYGFGCGYTGADQPEKSIAIEELIRSRDASSLSMVLRSISPTSRLYAAYGLFRLEMQGLSINSADRDLISRMATNDLLIFECGGCMYTYEPMNTLLKAAYLRAYRLENSVVLPKP